MGEKARRCLTYFERRKYSRPGIPALPALKGRIEAQTPGVDCRIEQTADFDRIVKELEQKTAKRNGKDGRAEEN